MRFFNAHFYHASLLRPMLCKVPSNQPPGIPCAALPQDEIHFRRSMLLVLWRCRWRSAPDHAAHIEEEFECVKAFLS